MTVLGIVTRGTHPLIVKALWSQRLLIGCRTIGERNIATEGDRKSEDANTKYEGDIKEKLLEASLPFVNKRGWTVAAINDGAITLGYPGVIHGVFANPSRELIDYFNRKCNKELNGVLTTSLNSSEEQVQPKKFIKYAVQTRLQMIIPYIERWPQAIAIMSQPSNISTAFGTFSKLVDDICYLSGDKSVNFDWYSRRAAIAMIYKSTELYMIQDKTNEFEQTWKFLERRLDNAFIVDQFLKSNENFGKGFIDVATATFTTLGNITGYNYRSK